MDWKNKLYFSDNLDILRREVPDASVDLIYLDPPFNSDATYNVPLKKDVAQGPLSGPAALRLSSAAQIMASRTRSVGRGAAVTVELKARLAHGPHD